MVDGKFFTRVVKDLQDLLNIDEEDKIEIQPISLWDDKKGLLPYGVNYSESNGN